MSLRGSEPFHIRHVDADPVTGLVRLHYGFDGGPEFVEEVQLPPGGPDRPPGFAAAARLLLLLAGTSYYKSRAPRSVVVEVPTTLAERALVTAVYDHGLREFAYTNRLEIPLVDRFDWAGGTVEAVRSGPLPEAIGRPLIPFGGGKDSTVVVSLVPEGQPVTVNPTTTHHRAARVLGQQLISVRRRIDRLDELTSPDRLNGHIPITAVISAIALLLAARDGYSAVVMANEAAASEPTLWTGPGAVPVNHQWSKGAAFEMLFRDAITEGGLGVGYFSLLRSMSEEQIVSILSGRREVLPHLLSCNRAFAGRTAGSADEAPQQWCGECPKCLFTYLLLATELGPEELVGIFGADLLDLGERTAGFEALWAPEKPFECVGERADAARAMARLAADPRWSGHTVVARLAESARRTLTEAPEPDVAAGGDGIPAAFRARLGEAFR